jgi:hypothetical protein
MFNYINGVLRTRHSWIVPVAAGKDKEVHVNDYDLDFLYVYG